MYSTRTNKRTIWPIIKEIIILIITLFLIRTCVFQSFYVPTGSMIPHIMVGDFVIGTKYNYGYSKYSIPFFPNLFSGRILNFYSPSRGDIVVFYIPEQHEERLIKRIIGLPGDTIQMINNVLHINDKPVESKYIGEDVVSSSELIKDEEHKAAYKKYLETLPNGKQYVARYAINNSPELYANTVKFTIPADEYFVMGDNRSRSLDSRSGYTVKSEQIIAKAAFILFSNEYNFYYNPFEFKYLPEIFKSFRTDRFFKSTNYNKDLKLLEESAASNISPTVVEKNTSITNGAINSVERN